MKSVFTVMSWFDRIFRRRRLRDELAEELREHIEEKIEQLMRLENLPRMQARQAAVRAFGNPDLLEARSSEVWQWLRLESILADLKFAVRRLTKSPGFAATVLLTLAIGIGANTAVFSVANSVLLKPLPYPDSERLVSLRLNAPGAAGLPNFRKGLPLSPSMYFTFSENNQTFQALGIWIKQNANVIGMARPEEVALAFITDGVLQTLGVAPLKGRSLTAADQVPNGPKNVMLSYGYWQQRFGGDRSVIGRAIVYWPLMRGDPYPGTTIDTARSVTFALRSGRAGTGAFLVEVQKAVWSVNPDLPVASMRTMQEIYGKSLARTSFALAMLGIAATMALALGIIGIYGVISYAVSQHRREIGIRLALGAQKGELRWMFVRSALTLTGVGVVFGLRVAAVIARLMISLLFGVSPLDRLSFAAVPLILAAAATLASFMAARRVVAVNPADALAGE